GRTGGKGNPLLTVLRVPCAIAQHEPHARELEIDERSQGVFLVAAEFDAADHAFNAPSGTEGRSAGRTVEKRRPKYLGPHPDAPDRVRHAAASRHSNARSSKRSTAAAPRLRPRC